MPTEIELTLEQTQQGVSYEVSFDESNANVLERFYTSAGNPVKEILLKLNLPDHRILKDGGEDFRYSNTERLSRSDEVLKLKNFKKDATLKLSKSTNQEWYEHYSSLKKMGFGEKWCDWVFSCISSYELEFLINGESIGSIRPSRGIRQGDPLSPYLFIIVADVLSSMVINALQNSLLSGIKMARTCLVISHVFFADDSLFFLKANVHKCKILVDILDRYCKASGQSINFTKSAALFSPNSSKFLQEQICELLKVECMDPKARYLGLPSIYGRKKGELFSFILEKVLQKVQGWKQKLISQAGPEILIKSVIQAIPSYAMQCYLLPNSLLEKLLCHIRRFFWSREIDKRHIHWLSWDRLSKPKDAGGLGFRDLRSFNLALLAKQGWRLLINPNSFRARVLKGLYYPNGHFLTARKGYRPSWLWQSILHGRDLLLQGVRWQVASGENISFWTQKWVPYEEDFYIRHPRDFISRIPISSTWTQDKLIGHYDSKGVYTVRSGYRQALNWKKNEAGHASSSGCPTSEFWKQIWRLKTVPKIKNFWWRPCSNALATREALFRRNCANSPTCLICHSSPETVEHLLFECEWTKPVWFGSTLGLRLDGLSGTNTSRVISLLQPFQSKDASTKFLTSFATLAWSILFLLIPLLCQQLIAPRMIVHVSAPPTSNLMKLNCDASFKDSSASIGIVARNCNGSLLQCVGEKCRSESVLAADLSAIRSACILAAANGWNHAIIESDSQSAISLAATEDVPPWALAALVSEK
ncbi:putative RNA-directed DNA polymerase [Tanacetum coccineum]